MDEQTDEPEFIEPYLKVLGSKKLRYPAKVASSLSQSNNAHDTLKNQGSGCYGANCKRYRSELSVRTYQRRMVLHFIASSYRIFSHENLQLLLVQKI